MKYKARVSYVTGVDVEIEANSKADARYKLTTGGALDGDFLSEENFNQQILENLCETEVDIEKI